MPRPLLPSLFALLLALGCDDSSGGSGSGPTITNLGLAAVGMHGEGELWALLVDELGQGLGDLNGDGDTADDVVSVYDLADGSLTHTGLAYATGSGLGPAEIAVSDVLVAFLVHEAEQGGVDRNGDGDALDLVLFVYDERTGVATSTGLAAAALRPAIGVGNVAFAVQESGQGSQDLNLDGDAVDLVLFVYDSRTPLAPPVNAQRSVTSELVFHDHAFGFTTDEASAGMDLDGDGDALDTSVFETFDLLLGGIEMVPLAIRGRPLAINADDWFLLVDEEQMGLDLNGDLDTSDGVLHETHAHVQMPRSLGLSSLGSFGATADGTDLAFLVQEIDGADRNGDLDLLDSLAVLYDGALELCHDPGLAMDPDGALVFVGDRLAFAADEDDQALDLNGDGDTDDDVVHLVNRASGGVVNLMLDTLGLQPGGGRLLIARSEGSAGEDWNGDGDQGDVVLFVWDPVTVATTNTRFASTGMAVAASQAGLLLVAPEGAQRADLNGDADTLDCVLVLHDFATGTSTSLGVATTSAVAGLTDDGRGVLLVSEAGEGVDLNGDADLLDSVLHRLTLP